LPVRNRVSALLGSRGKGEKRKKGLKGNRRTGKKKKIDRREETGKTAQGD